jgi:hypothetical protein
LSWQDISALLVVLVILIGIAMAARQVLVNPSEAAVMRPTTTATPQARTSNSTVQRTAQEQEWVEEMVGYWDEYNKCFLMEKGPAKCDCLNVVIKKFENLRERILSDGKDHSQFLTFWYDYYMKLIRGTWADSGCGSGTSSVAKPQSSTWSVFGRLSRFFQRF